jgi:hypothetical protein
MCLLNFQLLTRDHFAQLSETNPVARHIEQAQDERRAEGNEV